MQSLFLWPFICLFSTAMAQYSEHDTFQDVLKANTDTTKFLSMLYARTPPGEPKSPARKSSTTLLPEPEASTSSAPSVKEARRKGRSDRADLAKAGPVRDPHNELGHVLLTKQSERHIAEHHKTFDAFRKMQKWATSADAAQAVSGRATLRNDDRAAKKFRAKSNYMRLTSSIYAKKASKHYDTAHTALVAHQKLRQAGWKYPYGGSGRKGKANDSTLESSSSGGLDDSEGERQ